MSYLKEFLTQIENNDYPSFLGLWEEYCNDDKLDAAELIHILEAVKNAPFVDNFGKYVEKILPLWELIENKEVAYKVLQLIVDIHSAKSDKLRELAYAYLEEHYAQDPKFADKIRLIGLRTKEDFRGAITNFELLNHLVPGNFVFHKSGWGVGEVLEVSPLREHVTLEFDYVPGKKELSYANAFKTLVAIPKDHFLARRFGDPDNLEEEAMQNPISVVTLLLKDLGPKTAAEIKDELFELVIKEENWARWWQTVRSKLKKSEKIETPKSLKHRFRLLDEEISYEERLEKELEAAASIKKYIHTLHSFLKDHPIITKNEAFCSKLRTGLSALLADKKTSSAEELQLHFFLSDLSSEENYPHIQEFFKTHKNFQSLLNEIAVPNLKKRLLQEIKNNEENWKEIFLDFLFQSNSNNIKDYLFSELMKTKFAEEVIHKIEGLILHPSSSPEFIFWYFQKAKNHPSLPFGDREGLSRLFEALLILLSRIEHSSEHKELAKKVESLIAEKKYETVRKIIKDSTKEEAMELLLLATKCQSLTDHDIKIFHSLAEVAHPSLKNTRKEEAPKQEVIWTTPEGYAKIQKRIHEIGTFETVENAKEIEQARSHGDLRENSEFKAALEKRDRLQAELKFLSDQIDCAKILTTSDIPTDEVGIGSVIECEDEKGTQVTITLLGPWDADPDNNILSFQSKIASSIKGKKINDSFELQGKKYKICKIGKYL